MWTNSNIAIHCGGRDVCIFMVYRISKQISTLTQARYTIHHIIDKNSNIFLAKCLIFNLYIYLFLYWWNSCSNWVRSVFKVEQILKLEWLCDIYYQILKHYGLNIIYREFVYSSTLNDLGIFGGCTLKVLIIEEAFKIRNLLKIDGLGFSETIL